MQIKIASSTLILALSRATGFVSKTDVAPVTRCVRLTTVSTDTGSGYTSGLMVEATDNENALTARYESSVEEDGAVLVEAGPLLDMVKAMPAGDILLRRVGASRVLELRPAGASKAMFKINTLDPDDFPPIDVKPYQHKVTVSGIDLARMCTEVGFSIAKDSNRYGLNGARLEMSVDKATGQGVLRLVATDGSRLSWSQAPAQGALGLHSKVLLSPKIVAELARIIGEGEVTIESSRDARGLRVSMAGMSIFTRFVDGEFPDYRQVAPDEIGPQWSMIMFDVSRTELLMALRRVDMVAMLDRNHTAAITIYTDGSVNMSADNIDRGQAEADLTVNMVHKPGERSKYGVNASFLRDIVSNTPEAKRYRWRFGAALDPMTLTVEERDDVRFIVMPMRLD